mgnify:CR=1 FL=1
MARRKKHPRLPSGFGSIRYLGSGRRNCYGVHPPTTEFSLNGSPIRPKALCYVDDWMVGFAVLTAYKSGTYTPGMEADLKQLLDNADDTADDETIIHKILADYSRYRRVELNSHNSTFAEIYNDFYKDKYNGRKKYSDSAKKATRSAYAHCKSLWDRDFVALRYEDLQKVINECNLKHASLEHIVSLFRQIYKYAIKYEIVDTDYSANISIDIPDDDEHGEPFTDADLRWLWRHQDDPTAEFLLIMCYSGFRISEYKNLTVNLEENYFQGGIKTAAGKDRIVPIHTAILPLVKRRIERDGEIMACTDSRLRKRMYRLLEREGLDRHTPHDCRHTFSMLCERYDVRENDQKRMMGHAFKDVTNKVYGHRSLEDLRMQIEKIKTPYTFSGRRSGRWNLVCRVVVSFVTSL